MGKRTSINLTDAAAKLAEKQRQRKERQRKLRVSLSTHFSELVIEAEPKKP